MAKRVNGERSKSMATLLSRRAKALSELKRFDDARTVCLKSMHIHDQLSGRGEDFIDALTALAGICVDEGSFTVGLEHIVEARSLVKPKDSANLENILNLHAALLAGLERYPEALAIRKEALSLALELFGPSHPEFATSCINASLLYARLNQMQEAVRLAKQALAIFTKTVGPSHPLTLEAKAVVFSCQKALTDPKVKKQLASKSDRMCNFLDCGKVGKNFDFCLSCKTYYLCKEHKKKIDEHVVVCDKFPDVLPGEGGPETVVKCRRCRKQTKLMKCSVCEKVSYCGAQCQKEDWKRHKVFCGKK